MPKGGFVWDNEMSLVVGQGSNGVKGVKAETSLFDLVISMYVHMVTNRGCTLSLL